MRAFNILLPDYKMTWLYLVLFGILVIMVITMFCVGNREEYMTSSELIESKVFKTAHETVVGGTTATKMVFKDNSTVVRRLLGDTDKTIILLHNKPLNMQIWYPIYMFVQHVKNKGGKIPNLYSYDLMGHGTAWVPVDNKYNDANPYNRAWEYSNFTNNLYEIYKKYIGSGKFTLVGYGFGGAVAQDFALEHPDLLEALYILSMSIGPIKEEIPNENQYLVDWIAKNPLVTYLTLEQQFLQYNLCLWFQNNDPQICPNPQNRRDKVNTFGTVEYLLADKMYREASCQTYLQVNKLVGTVNFRPKWEKANLPFPVTFIAGNLDYYLDLDTLKKDIEIVKRLSTDATLYIVQGKHGFPLIYPEYIFQLIQGQDMSKDPLTIQTIK